LAQIRSHSLSPLGLSFLFILIFACFCSLPRVNVNARLAESFWGATLSLLIFLVLLSRSVARNHRVLSYEYVPKNVHYVQLMMHTSIYAYWGWYWREVYHDAPLILAQICFAYALDSLVCWSRRDKWILGFGPFPIVLSTNLFLWFRDDWFYLQFVMIAVGVLGKEFIKWKRDGRLTHIFNPSAFSLSVFSIVLIATKHTALTWGIEIADTFNWPPHIYLEIFLLGLIVQSLFAVTQVTLWSALSLVALNLAYTHVTGVYHFVDSNIPVAVFLGLHLLVTDPATSPRTNLGKAFFGILYGASVFVAYGALGWFGVPEFYDKLICVPFLNLTVRALDRGSEAITTLLQTSNRIWTWPPRRVNFVFRGIWIFTFATMLAMGFLAHGKDHPGGTAGFWEQACSEKRWKSCKTWVRTLNVNCQRDAGADCFKLGQILNEGLIVPRDAEHAGLALGRACDLGLTGGCSRLVEFTRADGKDVFASACERGDGASCFILGSLYSSGSGVSRDPIRAVALFQESCDHGWWRGCGRLGVSYLVGQGVPVNPQKAIESFEKGCQGQNAPSCVQAAETYQHLYGPRSVLVRERYMQACNLGLLAACESAKPEVHSGKGPSPYAPPR
jgi:hypothetical protein